MHVIVIPSPKEVLAHWEESGRSYFTLSALRSALGTSEKATKGALSRLLDTREIASPAKGFYVILSPGDRHHGCPPPSQLIPPLMEYRNQPYYAGILTASLYHGAAHQIPQIFQVVVPKQMQDLECGNIYINFLTRRSVASVPVQWLKGSRYSLAVSTVEATTLDLVGYMRHAAGGLNRVSGMIYELAEEMSPKLLIEAAQCSPITWAQRLGYLLEYAELEDKAALLKEYVRRRVKKYTKLVHYNPADSAIQSEDWKVTLNQGIDMEA